MDESIIKQLEEAERLRAEPWRRVLLDAADLIEARGHSRRDIIGARGQLCVMGAIAKAATGCAYDWKEVGAIEILRDRMGFHMTGVLAAWNEERAAAEVIEKLREVALT